MYHSLKFSSRVGSFKLSLFFDDCGFWGSDMRAHLEQRRRKLKRRKRHLRPQSRERAGGARGASPSAATSSADRFWPRPAHLGVWRGRFAATRGLAVADSTLLPFVLLAAAAVLLRLFGWRALLFLRPEAVKLEVETPADVTTVPGALEGEWDDLRALGFRLVGSHVERRPLGPSLVLYDAVHPEHPVSASLFLEKDGAKRLMLLTRSERGFVISTNYRLASVERPGRYLAGGLEGAHAERLLKAHLRRIGEIGPAIRLDTLEARVEAARDWYRGAGKPELRQQHAVALLWTLGALGMVGAAFLRLVS
jgi:hypothetical protein